MKKYFYTIPSALVLIIQCLTLMGSQSVLAAQISNNWVYKISIVKDAPTPDMATKAIAAAGMLLGSVTVAQGSDIGTIDEKTFDLTSRIKVSTLLSMLDSNLNMLRQSNGTFENGIAFTRRYTDKRGSKPQMQMVADMKRRHYAFSKGTESTRNDPMKYIMVDMAMLPYAFMGRTAPKNIFSIVFTDGKSTYSTSLTPKPEKIEMAGKTISAIRLSGFASGGSLDLWVREADGYPLHMRIGLNARYGAVLDQKVESVPTTLFVR